MLAKLGVEGMKTVRWSGGEDVFCCRGVLDWRGWLGDGNGFSLLRGRLGMGIGRKVRRVR